MNLVPDTDELKAKYAEIAALKRAIDEKQRLRPRRQKSAPKHIANEHQDYVHSNLRGGLSIIHKNVYNREKLRRENHNHKLAEARLYQAALARQEALHKAIERNRTKYDACDRVLIKGSKYAVVRGGKKLVPIAYPVADVDTFIMWNGRKYEPLKFGTLKTANHRKYVPTAAHPTNTRSHPEQCRYFTRTGMSTHHNVC